MSLSNTVKRVIIFEKQAQVGVQTRGFAYEKLLYADTHNYERLLAACYITVGVGTLLR
ncbi:MAG: hypothetical protein ABR557_12900 [Pyrinomonadaceae bacterium]